MPVKETRQVLQLTTIGGSSGFLSLGRSYIAFPGPIIGIMVTDVYVLLSNTLAEPVRCRCHGSLHVTYFSRSHRGHQS